MGAQVPVTLYERKCGKALPSLWRTLLVQECITVEAEGNYLVEGMEAWVKGEG